MKTTRHSDVRVLEKSSKSKFEKISTNESEILNFVFNHRFGIKGILKFIKNKSALTDNEIAQCLNLNVKTYRTYQNVSRSIKNVNLVEHAIMLLALIKHGSEVFCNSENFAKWLRTENFHFGKKTPIEYLSTINGIRYTDDRLTGLEYGDNA